MKTVYFIKPIGMAGPIKIGCSDNPNRRRLSLENWSPFPLEVIASIEGGFDIERRFHALFIGSHERREWFSWSSEIQAVIDAINAGTFDIATLPAPRGVCSYVGGKKQERTPLQRLQLSYSLRCTHMLHRTGYVSPIRASDVIYNGDPEEIATLDRYLADPAAHGTLVDADWARRKAANLSLHHAPPTVSVREAPGVAPTASGVVL